MRFSKQNINRFLFLELPAAFICGVRVVRIDEHSCVVAVRHRWINQNPFGSMYFAVQAMAAELSTGALVMYHIKESGRNISMLITSHKAVFSKKATGKITFTCEEGAQIAKALSMTQGEVRTLWLRSKGVDALGDVVCEMDFEWSLKSR